MTPDQPLITKYRPQGWDELIGNKEVYSALRRMLDTSSHAHAFLFTGGSGCGKTTTARIVGQHIGAEVIEIDAASFSGVDDIRQIVENAGHRGLTADKKMYIIDECHALSKPAWQALLKLIEEPPEYFYIALCTTESNKVPATIAQRCFPVQLRPVPALEIEDFLMIVADLEEWQVEQDVIEMVIQAAGGSPRKALSTLQAVHDAPSRDEAKRIVALQTESDPAIEIIQHVLKGGRAWAFVQKTIASMEDADFENSLIPLARYIITWMGNTKDEKEARRAWILLDMLMQPAGIHDPKSIFVAAVGRMLWANAD